MSTLFSRHCQVYNFTRTILYGIEITRNWKSGSRNPWNYHIAIEMKRQLVLPWIGSLEDKLEKSDDIYFSCERKVLLRYESKETQA